MKQNKTVIRNAHFLGTKIRNLRKRNNLTMEDLSARCVQVNVQLAPSISYLSMIERGKRVPSADMLEVIAQVFQKDSAWFLDSNHADGLTPVKQNRGGISGMSLEPSFLFSEDNLQIAIPELLSQAAVSGREFAHLLIRAHQEKHQNQFPDLESAAEQIGKKRLPLGLADLMDICKHMGLRIKWIEKDPKQYTNETGVESNTLMRSFFEPPNTIRINKLLQQHPERLKFDLASHIGHRALHTSNGITSILYAGNAQANNPDFINNINAHTPEVNAQDILQTWRDFECSFFAGALLCPKVPFRRMLNQFSHEIEIAKHLQITTSVAMRRMTAVSNYPHWHYFDAYPPGKLKVVYRGNGIPLPWGNMRMAQDPCQHWAVFRMISDTNKMNSAQLSVLEADNGPRLYACESVNELDLVGNKHVLCAGIDINPALEAQGMDAHAIAGEVKDLCRRSDGNAMIPTAEKKLLTQVAKILNIAWLERSIEKPARLICRRNRSCPRDPVCIGH